MFFFFKQKTAYEMLRSLVGSEMCIRDSDDLIQAVEELRPEELLDLEHDQLARFFAENSLLLSLIHI